MASLSSFSGLWGAVAVAGCLIRGPGVRRADSGLRGRSLIKEVVAGCGLCRVGVH